MRLLAFIAVLAACSSVVADLSDPKPALCKRLGFWPDGMSGPYRKPARLRPARVRRHLHNS